MIEKLFEMYTTAASSRKDWRLFPSYYQARLQYAENEAERIRACVDLIAGMTEAQVQKVYSRVTGHAVESSLIDPLG